MQEHGTLSILHAHSEMLNL